MTVAPAAISRLVTMLPPRPLPDHKVVKFEKVQCLGKMVARPSSLFGRMAMMSISRYGSRKMTAMREAAPAMIQVRGGRRVRGAAPARVPSRGAGLVVVITG